METESPKIGQLVVDVYQTKSYFVVQIPIAGVEEKDYLKEECYWGTFSAEISLPEDVNSSQIKASFKKGVLLIKIPRIKKEIKKEVRIET